MSIEVWWPKLRPATREWLIANNGDVIPDRVIDEITAAGGPGRVDDWWVRQDDANGLVCMPDEAIDRIEEIANEETPST